MFTGLGSDFFGNSIFILPNNITIIEAEFSISPLLKFIPLICTLLGAFFSFYVYHYTPISFIQLTETKIGKSLYTFLNGKYFFDIIYNFYIIRKSLKYGYFITNVLEKGIIEIMGPYGLANVLYKTGKNISKLDTGIVTSYALYIVLGLISLIFLVFFPLIINISEYPLLILGLRLFIVYILSFIFFIIIL